MLCPDRWTKTRYCDHGWGPSCSGVVQTVWERHSVYDFIDDENPITEQELKDGEHIVNMTMGALLPLLEKQNAILWWKNLCAHLGRTIVLPFVFVSTTTKNPIAEISRTHRLEQSLSRETGGSYFHLSFLTKKCYPQITCVLYVFLRCRILITDGTIIPRQREAAL